ncbi:MAG TPA: tetratricopeptide repeat protein [Streptosporangiaceae bacterium]|nr:tetratricopeptide repeat protein [Streptosporangiaceae bacterium]
MRAAITGLLAFAAAEEQVLLFASLPPDPPDPPEPPDLPDLPDPPGPAAEGPDNWAAVPLVAHSTHFKQQQSERTWALVHGHQIPSFGEIDHRSESVYASYAACSRAEVLAQSRQVTADLIDAVWALPDDALRGARVNGRMLWLQLIVRGFWHATGHLGDYYLGRGQAARAVALASHGVATARYLSAPGPAVGMACYNLACALARDGRHDQAASALTEAVTLNPDLAANASRDPDLAGVASG